MLRFRFTINALNRAERVFILLLLGVFVTELAVTVLFSSQLSRLGLFNASLLDASILALFYAVPLWCFAVQPLSGKLVPESVTTRFFSYLLLLVVLAVIFLTEFLIMLALPHLMPQADSRITTFADAFLTTLLSAPFLWWLTCSSKTRRLQLFEDDMLKAPVRLYILLLFMVFVGDLLMDILFPYLSSYFSHPFYLFIDAFLSTLFLAPLFWWLLVKPLLAVTLFQKTRIDAVYSQAVDAIITINSSGLIQSINPAAEKIFGYAAGDLAGIPGSQLFDESWEFLDGLINEVNQHIGADSRIISHEATGRCSDGSLVTIDVSVSKIQLEGQIEYLMVIRDISERKRMEKEIKESSVRLSLAINGSNDGIWDWDIQTDSVYYCPRFKELLGYRVDEIEHSFTTFEMLLHPEDKNRVMEAIRNHLEREQPYDIEYRLRTKSGNFHWYRAKGQVARDESGKPIRMAGSISDINVQKEALEALRETEVRFRQIFEQSEDAIIFFKPGTCSVIDVNSTAEKLYGYTKSELQESGLELIAMPEDLGLLTNSISKIYQDKMGLLSKVVNLRKDGTEIIVSMRGKMMTLQGVDVVYCTFRDVTARLRLENEARDIQAKLIQTNKMTSLGLLVSGVAHEINNPNNFIMANSQLLERSWGDALKILREYYRENGEFFIGGVPFSELDAKSPNLFAGITDGSRRINSIISNLKKFARNDGSIEKSDVNVNQVATSAVTILHYELNKFTDGLHVELGENIPSVKGNSQQLGQIIINLLMNACQALPNKKCGVSLTTVYDAAEEQVVISVADEGQGISPEKCAMIMEPFFTTKLDSGGTGLGLSICQSIAKDNAWSLAFTSEVGKGTTFILIIPVESVVERENCK